MHGPAVFINRLTLFFARELISVSLAAQEKKRNKGQKNNYCEKAAEVAANKAARQAASILKDFLAGKISEAAAKRLMNEALCK